MIKTEQPSSNDTAEIPVVRTLSESEIQERLYGRYLGKKKPAAFQLPAPSFPPSPTRSDSEWTGSELLGGELRRLRLELISLREEKENLASRLEWIRLEEASARLSAQQRGSGRPGIGRWLGRSFGFFLLIGVVGYLIGGRVLQAVPAVGDSTPYTVQVAVYNGKIMADRAQRFLNELGYDAFQVEAQRLDGQPRYRIYVGSFVTKGEAAQESRRLSEDTRFQAFKDAFVRIR